MLNIVFYKNRSHCNHYLSVFFAGLTNQTPNTMKSIGSISWAASLLLLLLISCKTAYSSSSSVESETSHQHFSNRTARQAEPVNSDCETKRVTKELTFDGCEPVTVTYKYCRGHCPSSNYIKLQSGRYVPMLDCNCCKPTYITKKKKLQVRCGNRMEDRRVFIPRLQSCRCGKCS